MKLYYHFIAVAGVLLCGCQNQQKEPAVIAPTMPENKTPAQMVIQPRSIPGTPRSANDSSTGGYAPTNVQAQLKIDVKEGTKEVKVIRDNADPFVITKPYTLKHADPYAVRNYIEAAVGSRSVSDSPAQATAVRFADGTGVVLVSAEEYRFQDSKAGKGLDSIIASLDRKGLSFAPEAGTHLYFPRISRAANLRDMLLKVGSYNGDVQFEVSPSTVVVDGELNALVIKAPEWVWREMHKMLLQYDRPLPEVKLSYRVLEIYAENDDRIGVDFQSWKNNEGVDLFSAGALARRNWGTFFASGVQDNGWNNSTRWNFNPKWNTRYLDFMTSIGKAKCMAQGFIVAQNRKCSQIEVNSGFFYDRTHFDEGFDPQTATSINDAYNEFTYTNPNPDTIQREAFTARMPLAQLQELYRNAGQGNVNLVPIGYTKRMLGTQTGGIVYGDATAYLLKQIQHPDWTEAMCNTATNVLAKYLTGYVKADGTKVEATYYNTSGNQMDSSPGIIHGWLQYPMVTDGFKFSLKVTPVVTQKAAKIKFELDSISLLGWNSDGSARTSTSGTATTMQLGTKAGEFIIGGLRKSESVRGTAGLPWFKDLPVLGRVLSTETESVKQSQLVLIAKVELSYPDDKMDTENTHEVKTILKQVNEGMKSRVGNMFFQQYLLDPDRKARNKRLDEVGETISDQYKEVK